MRKERVRRLCLRHKQMVAMSPQEGYSSLQEADGAASSCPRRVKSTKPPSHQGGRVVSSDAYHRERGCGNERKGGARARQKLKILGIYEHQTVKPAVRCCCVGCSVSRLHQEFGVRPIREHGPRSQSRRAGRASKHRAEHLGTTCWADAGLRVPNVTTAGMQLPYLESPPSTTHPSQRLGRREEQVTTPLRKVILFDYLLISGARRTP